MRMRGHWIAMVAIALSACASRPPAPPLAAIAGSAEAHQAARVAALAQASAWSMTGRVAVSNGKDGGNGPVGR